MIVHLLDANVWLALVLSAHVHHAVARDWVLVTAGVALALFVLLRAAFEEK